jgi:hypothetical protein
MAETVPAAGDALKNLARSDPDATAMAKDDDDLLGRIGPGTSNGNDRRRRPATRERGVVVYGLAVGKTAVAWTTFGDIFTAPARSG